MIGKGIHLSWAKNGCIWILQKIDGEVMHLITPSSGKKRIDHIKNACYTRKHEPTPQETP